MEQAQNCATVLLGFRLFENMFWQNFSVSCLQLYFPLSWALWFLIAQFCITGVCSESACHIIAELTVPVAFSGQVLGLLDSTVHWDFSRVGRDLAVMHCVLLHGPACWLIVFAIIASFASSYCPIQSQVTVYVYFCCCCCCLSVFS